MPITIHEPAVAAAVAAATNQTAQRAALFAPWTAGGLDVTVRSLNGATVRDITTYGPWVLDSNTPRGATLGALLARTVSSTGAVDRVEFRAGATLVFSMTAAVSPATADLVFPAAGGGVTAAARTNLSDPVIGKVTISADPALPVNAVFATALTLSVPNSGTNGTPVTVTVTPNGPIPAGGLSVTLAASNGGVLGSTSLSFTAGSSAAQTTTLTRSAAGSSTVTMTNSGGLTNTGSGAVYTSAAPQTISITGPATGIARTTSTPFTVSINGALTGPVTLTLSDGDANSRFYSLNGGDAVGTVSISPAAPVARFIYAPASAGAKTITATNNGGLVNAPGVAYTATAAVGSATPFRLTRGGATIGSYARLQQCREAGWQSGDVVKVAAGTYAMADDRFDAGSMSIRDNWPGGVEAGVNIDTLTIEAEDMNEPPFIDSSWWCASGVRGGGQPQFVTAGIPCHNLTLRGIRMRGSPAPTGSTVISAAFWQLTDYPNPDGAPATFTFDRCLFTGWGDAIKARYHLSTSFHINACVFIDNSDGAAGLHHDIYTGNNALTEVVGCTFIRTGTVGYKQDSYGHFVKSRCRVTTVRGNFFRAYMDAQGFGGSNSLINTPCGGVVEVTGNVLLDYGSMSNNSSHNILRSGEQQFPTSGEPSTDPLLQTHSYLIAQNTTLQLRGYPLGDGNAVQVLSLFHIPSNDPNGAVVSTGVPTFAMTGSGTMVPVTTTVRNNIVAHYDGVRAAAFLALYPNNTLASVGEVSADTGVYSPGDVAGSPAVNDAPFKWVGDYLPAAVRTDTMRGARAVFVPTWVPAATWEWSDVPGTIWQDQVPAIEPGDLTAYQGYSAQWDYSAPTYSEKNHEFYLFGGGHAGTALNAVSRYLLGRNTPTVEFFSPASSAVVRNAWVADPGYLGTTYFPDGKGYSPHSYGTLAYSDFTDELLTSFVAMGQGIPFQGAGWSAAAIGAVTREGVWRPAGYYPPHVPTPQGTWRSRRCLSRDGKILYYWSYPNTGETTDNLWALNLETRSAAIVGPSVNPTSYQHVAIDDSGTILSLGSVDSGGQWLAKFIDSSTGAVTNVTVSGASMPAGKGIYGLVWCSGQGYWLSLWMNAANVYDWVNPSGPLLFAKITKTGASTATAEIMTVAQGSGPFTRHRAYKGLHYDPQYKCALLAVHPLDPVKAIKVA